MLDYLKTIRFLFFIIYLILIVYLSLSPATNLPIFSQIWKFDKLIHFVEYFGFGFLLLNVFLIKLINYRHWMFIIIFIIIFPIIDETLQYFTPTRITDFYDVIADWLGGSLGCLFRKKFSA